MKKQHKSFAERARQLESRYKRLAFDPIEQKEFEAEMEKLQAEQEQMRQLMGLNEQPQQQVQQFPWGGFTPYGVNNIAPQKLPEDAYLTPEQLTEMGSSYQPTITPIKSNTNKVTSKTPINPVTQNTVQQEITFNPVDRLMYRTNNNSLTDKVGYADWTGVNKMYNNPTIPLDTKTLAPMTTLNDEQIGSLQSQLNPTVSDKQSFLDKNKQYLPYAISGASNIASNLLLAAMAKKNQTKINPVLANPTQINMEPQAEQMRKDAGVSKNIGMKQARDLGLNAGATLANMGAIGSGVDRNLANTLTNLYGQQEQYNVGAANQFALQNQDAANRANMVNAQFEQQANQDRLGYIGGALGTIPGVMKDIRMDKADAQMRDVMDRYYQSIGGRNYATVGSIFKDPKSGFKYKVKPDLTLEQVK